MEETTVRLFGYALGAAFLIGLFLGWIIGYKAKKRERNGSRDELHSEYKGK